MIAVVQRVSQCAVSVENQCVGRIDAGLMVLLGVSSNDTADDAAYLAEKIPNLRIFEDGAGKMNRSLMDTGGSLLVVSQFTLLGDTRKGRRPSFVAAAGPDHAAPLYRAFAQRCSDRGVDVATGRFGAHMAVSLVNDGPVTLIIESPGHRDKDIHKGA